MGNFNMLPSDIMLDILSRLPVESVLECKLVCKPWRNVVHHPSFSQTHLNHLDSGKLTCIFLSHEQGLDEFYYSEYDDNCEDVLFDRKTRMILSPPFLNYSLIGSSNGLICFNLWFLDCNSYQYDYGPAYICNPITREYIMLPTSKRNYWWTGFGYILSTNEYKVVRIHESGGDSNVGNVQVYTLGSGDGWRNAGTMDINIENVRQCAGAFANEALYWVNNEGTIILAFHLADEKSSQLPPPPTCLTRAGVPYLGMGVGVLGDFLSATYYYPLLDCDIWLLKKNNNDNNNNDFSWSKEFSFRMHMAQPFEITKSGRLLCYEYTNIYSYSPEGSSAKMHVSFGKYISKVIRHKNTLISLKVLGEKDTKTMEYGESASSNEKIETTID